MGQPFFFLLGADDPEMRMIATLLNEQGLRFEFATANGAHVHVGNAYQADPVSVPKGHTLITIECEPEDIARYSNEVIRIDHHREGDYGFALSPSAYWDASSIGQLHKLLETPATTEAREMAACDHCFSAAVHGECPGINESSVRDLKIAEIAEATNTDARKVYDRIYYHFRFEIEKAPLIEIVLWEVSWEVRDLRQHDLGIGHTLDLLTAQVAAMIEKCSVLLRNRDEENGPYKWTLSGNPPPDLVSHFIRKWGPDNGLVDVYGVPLGGYAGGYVKSTTS